MQPLKLSQTIEENITELFAWLLLFPVTLYKLVLHPLSFFNEVNEELLKPEEKRFDSIMPPVLFLLLGSVPLSIIFVKTSEDVASMPSVAIAFFLFGQ